MARVLSVMALTLVLVFCLGVPATSGIIPFEDYNRPSGSNDLGDGGGEDEDHPWGGDRVVGGGSGTGTSTYRYVDIEIITGYPLLDIFITRIVASVTLEEVRERSWTVSDATLIHATLDYRKEK
jgi:hypothetical protein